VAEASQAELMAALQKYLGLMYDCDTSRFDQVFSALCRGDIETQ
jgi:hypothetical protein